MYTLIVFHSSIVCVVDAKDSSSFATAAEVDQVMSLSDRASLESLAIVCTNLKMQRLSIGVPRVEPTIQMQVYWKER